MKKYICICMLFLFIGCANNIEIKNYYGIKSNYNNNYSTNKYYIKNISKMGLDTSSILNVYEADFFNNIFDSVVKEFNFVEKKIAFIGPRNNKKEYFISLNQNSGTIKHSILYIFNNQQKIKTDGYDAAIVCWFKYAISIDDVIKRLKKNKQVYRVEKINIADTLKNFDKMGIDSSEYLNDYESEYFNKKFSHYNFDFKCKKVCFLGPGGLVFSNKNKYFDYFNKHSSILSSLYVFDKTQKEAKEIIRITAINDQWTGNAKDNKSPTWGWGKINAQAIMKYLEETSINEELNMDLYVFPNPATDYINIIFDNPYSGTVRIDLVDAMGKTIATPINKYCDEGIQAITINDLDLHMGAYFLRMTTNKISQIKSFIVK